MEFLTVTGPTTAPSARRGGRSAIRMDSLPEGPGGQGSGGMIGLRPVVVKTTDSCQDDS